MTAAVLARASKRLYTPLLHARQAGTYVPGGPILRGSVNDATPYPPPSRTHGSHHWAFERLLSASLIPITGATFALGAGSPVLDGVLSMALVMHSHLGLDQLVVDYVHPRKFPVIGRLAKWGLRVATVGALVGVYQFNTNDIGLTELISRLWHA